jgi:hypothetical protein
LTLLPFDSFVASPAAVMTPPEGRPPITGLVQRLLDEVQGHAVSIEDLERYARQLRGHHHRRDSLVELHSLAQRSDQEMIRPLGRTGICLTTLGFGSTGLGSLYRAQSEDGAMATVEVSYSTDIRYFDTAPLWLIPVLSEWPALMIGRGRRE